MSPATAAALMSSPALAAVYSFHEAAASQPLPRLARRMLELLDGTRTLGEVFASLQIPEAQGLAAVRKLSTLGLIAPHGRADQSRTSLSAFERGDTLRGIGIPRVACGFSEDEEAFFASEVQPAEEEQRPTLHQRWSLFLSDLILRLHGTAL